MTRRCSHCSNNGHNSRTCPNRGVKLFGVLLTDGSTRKSGGMGNLTHHATGGGGGSRPQNGAAHDSPNHTAAVGYSASEDFIPGSSSCCERTKGVPWTEKEHRTFLLGLQKVGKGNWLGISRNFVISKTPTQVASHAQKYFIRQSNLSSRKRRRSSVFDIVAEEPADAPVESHDIMPTNHPQNEAQSDNPLSDPPNVDEQCESKASANSKKDGEISLPIPKSSQYSYPLVYPAYMTLIYPLRIPYWQGYNGPVFVYRSNNQPVNLKSNTEYIS